MEFKTSPEDIVAYRRSTAMNQSLLKELLYIRAPKDADIETEAMGKGNVLDCLTLTPTWYDQFYHTADTPSITDGLMKVARCILEDGLEPIEAARTVGYQSRWGDDAILRAFKEGGLDAFVEHMRIADGKTVVGVDERMEFNYEVTETTRVLDEYATYRGSSTQRYTQVPLYDTLMGVPCKGLADLLLVDESTIQIVDLKRTDVPLNSYRSQATRLYIPFQLAFYYDLLNVMQPIVDGYPLTQRNPALIVYSGKDRRAMLIELSDSDLEAGRKGYVRLSNVRIGDDVLTTESFYPGYEQGLRLHLGESFERVFPQRNNSIIQ